MPIKTQCNFCQAIAIYDAPGSQALNYQWAYFCETHYRELANVNFPPTVLENIK